MKDTLITMNIEINYFNKEGLIFHKNVVIDISIDKNKVTDVITKIRENYTTNKPSSIIYFKAPQILYINIDFDSLKDEYKALFRIDKTSLNELILNDISCFTLL